MTFDGTELGLEQKTRQPLVFSKHATKASKSTSKSKGEENSFNIAAEVLCLHSTKLL